jgi:glycosyltransferase involved in cell wall biosynthesis
MNWLFEVSARRAAALQIEDASCSNGKKHPPGILHLFRRNLFASMRIALVAPPFIAVPPKKYGGTELFVAELASGLRQEGIDVTVYTNGESAVDAPIKWLYEREDWPLNEEVEASLKGLNHCAWAMKDAAGECDIIHLNNAPGLSISRFVDPPVVYTIHHAHEPRLTDFYRNFPGVSYVTISRFQQRKLRLPHMHAIHHGIDVSRYRLQQGKRRYLSFLGRIAPPKGTHLAIETAKRAGIPLKIAGEIQPCYRDYWENMVKPNVDGRFIEYVGEVGPREKNELLGDSVAMLFPIQWDEPFGLVLIEAMACGAPVLALPGGSVNEIVAEGTSGHVRGTVVELAECARSMRFDPAAVRQYVEKFFSARRMARDYVDLYTGLVNRKAGSAVQGLAA